MIPKFRAWHKQLKRMFSVSQVRWHCETQDKLEYVCFYEIGCDNEVDKIELMQWTQCVDVNGVEIFEDDILKINATVVVCVSKLEKGGFYVFNNKTPCCPEPLGAVLYEAHYEVVGNIWANPELLAKNNHRGYSDGKVND